MDFDLSFFSIPKNDVQLLIFIFNIYVLFVIMTLTLTCGLFTLFLGLIYFASQCIILVLT